MNLKWVQIEDCDLDGHRLQSEATVKEGSHSIRLTMPVKSFNSLVQGSLRDALRNCSRFGITWAIL